MKVGSRYSNCSAFSLVEVAIAIAIAAIALISILGLIPTATKGTANSADQTAIGTMFEDIEDRIKNRPLLPGPVKDANDEPFYYDQRGSYIDPDWSDVADSSIVTRPFFRVEVQLIKPATNTAGSANYESALAVQVKIFWPIDESGAPIHPEKPGSEITFLTGAQTGPGWIEVDGSYQPKIEY